MGLLFLLSEAEKRREETTVMDLLPSPKLSHSLFLLLSSSLEITSLLLLLLVPATSGALLNELCSRTEGNYTANSTYQANLDRLLSSLSANAPVTGYYSDALGNSSDRVYGFLLCRGDVDAGTCRNCSDVAKRDLVRMCPFGKGASVWYDECLLRYSNQWSFSNSDDPTVFIMWNAGNISATEVGGFNKQLGKMMDELVRYAEYNSSGRFFATGEADFTAAALADLAKIYGLVQCTLDQSVDVCVRCLREIIGSIPTLPSGTRGGRMYKSTCYFRYELYPFYRGTAMVALSNSSTNVTKPPALLPPSANPTSNENKKNGMRSKVLAIVIPVGVVLVLISAACICLQRMKAAKKSHYIGKATAIESLRFDLSTLKVATDNFSDSYKLGEGGFGAVYKGMLPDGQKIAVKKLSASSRQGLEELKNEVILLAKQEHRNLVRLLGVCVEEEEMMLVYEYLPNTSLDTFLFDPTKRELLNWDIRYKLIEGIARGLLYLHEESRFTIIHRDLKASNILLDANMNPKISDFGISRLFGGGDQTHASTSRVVGTFGYMAPEYVTRGQFSYKSDVFSFGVLVLEIVTGLKNSGFSASQSSPDLLSYAWEHWMDGTVLDIVDRSLGGDYRKAEALRCIQIGLLCVQEAPADRPAMSSVVIVLDSYSTTLEVPAQPAFFAGDVELDVLLKSTDRSMNKPVFSLNELSISQLDPR